MPREEACHGYSRFATRKKKQITGKPDLINETCPRGNLHWSCRERTREKEKSVEKEQEGSRNEMEMSLPFHSRALHTLNRGGSKALRLIKLNFCGRASNDVADPSVCISLVHHSTLALCKCARVDATIDVASPSPDGVSLDRRVKINRRIQKSRRTAAKFTRNALTDIANSRANSSIYVCVRRTILLVRSLLALNQAGFSLSRWQFTKKLPILRQFLFY